LNEVLNMSSNEKVTHPRTPRPALSTEPRQAPLGHADVRLTNQPTNAKRVLDAQGRPIRPGA
jgi:hypothetical protein